MPTARQPLIFATCPTTAPTAKIKGCSAVGIAGSADKCRYVVDELGFDACINYKTEDLAPALRAACPNGVDIDFENVGGAVLPAGLRGLNKGARIPHCGTISAYNPPPHPHHPELPPP